MTTYTGPDRSWDAGVPKQTSDDFAVTPEGFIVGETPRQFVQDMPAAASQNLAAYTVVGLDANGRIVPAVWHATYSGGGVRAIGILMYPVVSGAGQYPVARVLRAAAINPNFAGLIWNAAYDTLAKKIGAFEGAPSPTQFIVRPLAHATPVLP